MSTGILVAIYILLLSLGIGILVTYDLHNMNDVDNTILKDNELEIIIKVTKEGKKYENA